MILCRFVLGSTPSPQTSANHQNSQTTNSKSKKNKDNHQTHSETSNKNNKSGQTGKEKKGSNKKGKADKQNQQQHNNCTNDNNKNNSIEKDTSKREEIDKKAKNKNVDEDTLEKYHEQAFTSNSSSRESEDIEIDTDDRHSLLDNHDLLDNSEHSLLEDHDILSNINNISDNNMLLMNRHSELMNLGSHQMLQCNMQMKPNLDFGLSDNRNLPFMMLSDTNDVHILRERQNEIMRQNDLLRQNQHGLLNTNLAKQYINSELAKNDLMGSANMYQNRNILPPFGMRMDGTTPSNFGLTHTNQGVGTTLIHGANVDNHLLTNGFSNENSSKGRYNGENSMDKFFTDFHKNLQMKSMISQRNGSVQSAPEVSNVQHSQLPQLPVSMQSLAFIESQHLQRNYSNSQDFSNIPVHLQNGVAELNSDPMLLSELRFLGIVYLLFEFCVMKYNNNFFLLDLQQRSASNYLQLKSSMIDQQQSGFDGKLLNEPQDQQALATEKSIVDDDLDFDPIKETQKALAEMMATEVLQQSEPKTRYVFRHIKVSFSPIERHIKRFQRFSPESNDRLARRNRHTTTGFTHMNAFGIGVPRPQPTQGLFFSSMVCFFVRFLLQS